MKFNVYRSIHSNDEVQWQLIAYIEADNKDIAFARAKFIRSFSSWDDKPGKVIDPTLDYYPPNTVSAKTIDHIVASESGNHALQRMVNIMKDETERHHSMMNNLNTHYADMLNIM